MIYYPVQEGANVRHTVNFQVNCYPKIRRIQRR